MTVMDQRVTITYNNTAPPASGGNALAALILAIFTISLIVGAIVAVRWLLWQAAIVIATLATALLSSIVALAPWLAGGALVMVLVALFIWSIPGAVADVVEIRQRRMIVQRQPRLLETKEAKREWVVVEEEHSIGK